MSYRLTISEAVFLVGILKECRTAYSQAATMRVADIEAINDFAGLPALPETKNVSQSVIREGMNERVEKLDVVIWKIERQFDL